MKARFECSKRDYEQWRRRLREMNACDGCGLRYFTVECECDTMECQKVKRSPIEGVRDYPVLMMMRVYDKRNDETDYRANWDLLHEDWVLYLLHEYEMAGEL